MADRLIARVPILTDSRQYQPGDVLPSDHRDVEAWLECGSAVWRDESYTPPKRPKAKLATATPGLPGLVVGGDAAGDNLVGKVPATEQRRKPRCKRPVSKT